MTTLNKAPKIVLAALNGASGNLEATKYTFKNKKAHEWLTKNLGLVTDDNQHVVCGHVVNFDWNIQQWYVEPFANVAPEVTETDTQGEPEKISKKPSMCKIIRIAALEWKGTRKEFIEAMHAEHGTHKGTLGTQWAKAHREGV